jgi:ABC-type lipoprotein release transport system permease subunit
MIWSIAWRNVWRNPGRSLIVIASIIVGIWALVFLYGFSHGFLYGYIDNTIKYELSNLQIHHPDFKTDQEIKYVIKNGDEIARTIRTVEGVEAVSVRSLSSGMISSSRKATGVQIIGVDPQLESSINDLENLITEGTYFKEFKRNPVIIGQKLAEELKVKIRSKVVITFHDIHGNITAGSFRVEGIIKSTSLKLNQGAAFVRRSDLNKIMELPEAVHEIAIVTHHTEMDPVIRDEIDNLYPDLLTESWMELAPEMNFMMQWFKSSLLILVIIIMIALAFGLVNTMLMSVLERFKELGMLMAIGMNKSRIFLMIVLETFFLALVGGPLGMLAGYGHMSFLSSRGMDLTDYSQGLESLGYESIIYPNVETALYWEIAVAVLITAFVGALYPAYKAMKMNPIEALHKI